MSIEKLGKYLQEYSARNKFNKPYPVYSVTNKIGFCVDYFDKDVSSKNKSNYKIVPRGYFAYNPSRVNVGSIDWQHKEDNVIVSPLYVVFKASAELNNDYLLYFLKSSVGKALIRNHTAGSVRDSLKFKDLCNISLNVPDIHEQESMINQLKHFESAIDSLTRRIELLDEQVKSLFNELTKDAERKRLLSFYATLITKGASPGWQGFEYQESGVLFVTSENVREGVLDLSKPKYLPAGINDLLPRSVLHRGDFLINIVGASIGRAAIYDRGESANINQAVALVRPANIDPLYLLTFLNSDAAISQYSEMKKGGARDNLSLKNISDLLLPDIDIERQKGFARKAKQIDKLRFNYRRQIEVLQELLDKKMEEYFGANV